ncbi:leptin receptor-like isoform X1 [Acipenser ruthenus]|uniref:leptin receptor-like isoform X1 n=1 Tax=Acipenser ruthenus TaxID=7906 RepID=UPI002740F3E4|nr:leptin receptor-like isoform X1 [Acipenser ruthenus]XP_033883588.3 leptin receptor-like isoform X1 [Acipenser ruthenus]XP_033883591.3 leptin receptor-like isoform X1 [Acipenser ruthenus]XP_058891076.1 leptin receptor-like isoform X1 [Acipenser ruthenus]
MPTSRIMGSFEKVFWLLCLAAALQAGAVAQIFIDEDTNAFRIPPWHFSLSCNLYNETVAGINPSQRSLGNSNKQTNRESAMNPHNTDLVGSGIRNETRCHLWSDINSQRSLCDDKVMEVFCLNILCWVDGNLSHLTCNLMPSSRPPGTSMLSTVKLHYEISDSSSEGLSGGHREAVIPADQSSCSGEEALQCVIPGINMNYTYSLLLSVTHHQSRVEAPAMRATPGDLVKPHPPRSLQYEMTPEGVSRISWRSPEPAPYDLQYEVRYSVNATENTWTNVEGILEAYVTPGDLKAGLDYTAQARCKRDRRPGLWSNWSEPLYIRVQEVTYIPATVLTAAGSNVTVYCVFNNQSPSVKKVVWWLNASEKVPEKLYSVMNDHVSRVTLPNVSPSKPRGYHLLQCCQQTGETSDCNFRYAQIYAVDIHFLISCETNGYQTNMTCKWNPNGIQLPQGSCIRFMYRIRNDISCDALQGDLHGADAKECQLGVHDECTFQPLYLYFCHIMWIEIHYKLVTLRSHPANVTPMDVVKPDPPFNVKAEITRTEGFLNISWERRELPVYDLQFEVRYSGEEQDRKWKTLGNVYNEQALMEVADPCVVYVVQVRCKRHNGTGHWSTWSSPVNTRVNDIRAPARGPDFWRVIHEDTVTKQANVTLLLKPLNIKEVFCTVKGFRVQHQTSSGSTWSDDLSSTTAYSFPWTEDFHSVSVIAFNSLGSSTENYILNVSRHVRKIQCVQSFRASIVNSSCVALSWKLLPDSPLPESFIIEWERQKKEEGEEEEEEGSFKWVRAPSNQTAKYYLSDAFFVHDAYRFILYPIFPEGEGWPETFYINNKGDNGRSRGGGAAYILLLIIAFLSGVLLVTLAISQHQMKKLVWKDVPNPNNCSWAQGVDFKKAETIGNLFKHHERLTSGPLLLESERISEAVIVEKMKQSVEEKETRVALDISLSQSHEPQQDSPPPEQHSHIEEEEREPVVYPDSSGEPKIEYATILPSDLYKQQKSISSSSDEGNFSANNSDISGSFPNNLWEVENQSCIHLAQVNPRMLRSFNSSEGFSEASDDQDDSLIDEPCPERDIYYLGQVSTEEEGEKEKFLKEDAQVPCQDSRDETGHEANPLLSCHSLLQFKMNQTDLSQKSSRLYMSQFRAVSNTIPKITKAQK